MAYPILSLAAIIAATLVTARINAQTTSFEFASNAVNPTGNGPTINNQVITFENNNSKNSGNTFATFLQPLAATYSLTNQQYILPTSQISTGRGMSFGANQSNSSATAPALGLFEQMNSISGASSDHFTSAGSITSGIGFDINNNKAVSMFLSAKALDNAGASTGGRYYFGDLTITFSQAVTNPVLHVVGMGGYYQALGFSAELELQTPDIKLSKLSGSCELDVSSGTKILNTALHPGSVTGWGAASGSVLASGHEITSLTFRVYLRGDGFNNDWSGPDDHQGDVFLVGVSLNIPVTNSGNALISTNGLEHNKMVGTANGVTENSRSVVR